MPATTIGKKEDAEVGFHPSEISVRFLVDEPHRVQVLDVRGRVLASVVGRGRQEHFFERSRFGEGIFFVRATVNGASKLKRYFLRK